MTRTAGLVGCAVAGVLAASAAVARESDADLAKQLSNPVANLISIPL
jgi:hypothetical protein